MNSYAEDFGWGTLQLEGDLYLSGGDLYVSTLTGLDLSGTTITNIFGNGFNIYYTSLLIGGVSYTSTLTLADGYSLIYEGGGNGGSSVPEPATMLLLGSGLVGLAVLGKRFRR